MGLEYLSLIDSTFHDDFLSGSLPFVDTFISSDVPNALWVDLQPDDITSTGVISRTAHTKVLRHSSSC